MIKALLIGLIEGSDDCSLVKWRCSKRGPTRNIGWILLLQKEVWELAALQPRLRGRCPLRDCSHFCTEHQPRRLAAWLVRAWAESGRQPCCACPRGPFPPGAVGADCWARTSRNGRAFCPLLCSCTGRVCRGSSFVSWPHCSEGVENKTCSPHLPLVTGHREHLPKRAW